MALLNLNAVPMADYGKGLNLANMAFGMPKKDEDEEEKQSSGILGNIFTPTDTTKKVAQNQVPNTASSFNDYAISDVVDPKTYTGELNAPGGLLDTILSFTVPGYSILRNLKAMEDPEKYGKGTLYGTIKGYGDKKGLADGNPFGSWFGGSSTSSAPLGYGAYSTQAYNNLGFGQPNTLADDMAVSSGGNMDWGTMTEAEASAWDEIG